MNAVDNLSRALINVMDTEKNHILNAIGNAETYYWNTYKDLYHLAELFKEMVNSDEVDFWAEKVMNAVQTVVIAEAHGSAHAETHGMSIYAPSFAPSAPYTDIVFSQQTAWDDLLVALYS